MLKTSKETMEKGESGREEEGDRKMENDIKETKKRKKRRYKGIKGK